MRKASRKLGFTLPHGAAGRLSMPILSESEARAEAVAIVLQIMLGRLGNNAIATLRAEAFDVANDVGVPAITEELTWLFSFQQL